MTATAVPPLQPPKDCTYSENDWRVLSGLWHPIAYAEDVPADKPFKTQLLDERLVVYRSGDDFVVAKDLCIHRGAPISDGWMEGCEIVCPYHGFRYGPNGACTRVPAQPNSAIPKKLRLQTFPNVVKYGVVWTCLAGEAKLPLPDWPDFERDDLKFFRLKPLWWNCSPTRQVENFNDVAHLSWLHADTFGNPAKPQIDTYDVEDHGTFLRFELDYERASVEKVGKDKEIEFVHFEYDLSLPFYCRLKINMPDGRQYQIYDMASPWSLHKTNIFFRMARNWDLDGPEEDTLEMQYKVMAEDQPIVEGQRPEEIPLDLSEEFHIRADLMSTYYRRALVKLGLGKPMAA